MLIVILFVVLIIMQIISIIIITVGRHGTRVTLGAWENDDPKPYTCHICYTNSCC